MSTHKYIDWICGVALVAAVAVAVLLLKTGALLGGSGGGKTMAYASTLFDTASVHSVEIFMDDWDSFIDTCTNEEYAACTVVIDNEAFKNVAIRAKGNTSLSSVASYGNDRYSFKIEFDHYDSGKTYHGLDKLCLNNIIQDPTYMKDYLVYQMMGEMDADAPLCSYVYIKVNGEDWGLYLAVEGVEESFLLRNYGTDYGDLYKPDSMDMGGGRGNGRDFKMDDLADFFGLENLDEDKQAAIQEALSSLDLRTLAADLAERLGLETDGDAWTDLFSRIGELDAEDIGALLGLDASILDSDTLSQIRTALENMVQSIPGLSGQGGRGMFGGEPPERPGGMAFGDGENSDTDENGQGGRGMLDGEPPEMPGGMPSGDGENSDTDENGQGGRGMLGGEPPEMPGGMSFGGEGGGGMRGGFGGGNVMGSNDVALIYTDDDPESYSNIFGNAKTDVTEADQARLIEALRKLSSNEDLENAVDVDEVIRYFVVHNFVVNFDSYTGSMLHNYYLYEEDGRLSMIPWDYNLAFGGFQSSTDATGLVNYPIDTPISGGSLDSRPMLAWIFNNPEYLAMYHEIFGEFIRQVFESGAFAAEIDRVKALLAPYVEQDPTKFYTYDAFDTGVDTLKAFCLLRAESVSGQLAGDIPSTADGQAADDSALIDAGDIQVSAMGSMGGDMGGGMGGERGGFSRRFGGEATGTDEMTGDGTETAPEASFAAAEEAQHPTTAGAPGESEERGAPPEASETAPAEGDSLPDAGTEDTSSGDGETTPEAAPGREDMAPGEGTVGSFGPGGQGGMQPPEGGMGEMPQGQGESSGDPVLLFLVALGVLVLGLAAALLWRGKR